MLRVSCRGVEVDGMCRKFVLQTWKRVSAQLCRFQREVVEFRHRIKHICFEFHDWLIRVYILIEFDPHLTEYLRDFSEFSHFIEKEKASSAVKQQRYLISLFFDKIITIRCLGNYNFKWSRMLLISLLSQTSWVLINYFFSFSVDKQANKSSWRQAIPVKI